MHHHPARRHVECAQQADCRVALISSHSFLCLLVFVRVAPCAHFRQSDAAMAVVSYSIELSSSKQVAEAIYTKFKAPQPKLQDKGRSAAQQKTHPTTSQTNTAHTYRAGACCAARMLRLHQSAHACILGPAVISFIAAR